jgi:hypothetical protein
MYHGNYINLSCGEEVSYQKVDDLPSVSQWPLGTVVVSGLVTR